MKAAISGICISLVVWLGIYLGVTKNVHTIIGYDLLALQSPHFQHKRVLRYLPPTFNLGILDGTFGLSIHTIRLYLNRRYIRVLRIHLANGSGLRNKLTQPNEITHGYKIKSFDRAIRKQNKKILRYMRQRTRVFKDLSIEYPDTVFMISPVLEHNLTTSSYRILAREVHRVWPEVQLVNNPQNGKGRKVRGALLEDHNKKLSLKAEVISLDGIGFENVKLRSWLNKALDYSLYFIWDEAFNCRVPGEFVPPQEREVCISVKKLKRLNKLLRK